MTNHDENPQPLNLPPSYADGRTDLIRGLLDSIEEDSVLYSQKWRNGNRRSVTILAPILDRVGIADLSHLSNTPALGDLRLALAEAIRDGSLGAPSSVEKHTANFAKRCAALGLSQADFERLKAALKQARKDAKQHRIKPPEITGEDIAALVAEMDRWAAAPLISEGQYEICEGVTGYQGRRVTRQRRDRALAFIAISVSGAIRKSDVIALRPCDVQGSSVTAYRSKGMVTPEPFFFQIHPLLSRFVSPLIEACSDQPSKSMFGGNGDSCTNDARIIQLAAGLQEHYGRTGLHAIRKALITANYAEGRSAAEASAALGNSPMVAERIYAEHDRADQATAAQEAWGRFLDDVLAPSPEWRYADVCENCGSESHECWIVCSDDDSIISDNISPPRTRPISWEQLSIGGPTWTGHLNPWTQGEDDGQPFTGLWRFRTVEIQESWGWDTHHAWESNQGDLLVRWYGLHDDDGRWVPDENGQPATRTLWLKRGLLADCAPKWWVRQDSNLSRMLPLENLVPRYAALVRQAIEAGDADEASRLLRLLESLGGIG